MTNKFFIREAERTSGGTIDFSAWVVRSVMAISLFFLTTLSWAQPDYKEFSGNIKLDYRYFPNDGLDPRQENSFFSIAFEPEYVLEWNEGKQSLVFKGFGRLDQHDSERTHFDIRELYWQTVADKWELSIGVKKIYWGVTESVHLVDVINQTDIVESFDGEAKLGQPMVHFSYPANWGTLDLFLLPYHRKRIFPGSKGRLGPTIPINDKNPVYESDAENTRPDLAARWSHSVGIFDFGVSHFYGNGREPFLFPGQDATGFTVFYPLMNQTGLDVQITWNAFLWKFEAIRRTTDFQDFNAAAAGLEYTISNVANSGLDIGLLGEYLYDSRDEAAFSSLDNDIFIGSRLAFNDTQSTEILLGGIFDVERSTKFMSIEASRRFGDSWKFNVEARIFEDVDPAEFAYFIRRDSFLQFSIAKYF